MRVSRLVATATVLVFAIACSGGSNGGSGGGGGSSGGSGGSTGGGGGSTGGGGGSTGGGGGSTGGGGGSTGGGAGGGAADAGTPPTITLSTPGAGNTNVDVRTTLSLEFSEPMNQATVDAVLSPAATLGTPTWNPSGTTVTWTPVSPLQAARIYMVTVTGRDSMGDALATPTVFSFATGTPDTAPPTVLSTNPANGAANVLKTATLSVTFSEPMNQTSVGLAIAPSVMLNPLSFDPSGTVASVTGPLNDATPYTVTITGSDVAGNALGGSVTSFQFTTASPPDVTPPTVSSTIPANGAMAVASTTSLGITFSESMNQAATAAAITVMPAVSCVGGWLWNAQGTFASCQPSSALVASTPYTVTVGTGARDLAMNPLAAAAIFSFTTAAGPDVTPPTILSTTPGDGTGGAAFNTNIVVTFSEPMDLASAQTAFQITAPVGVTGVFSWSNGGATMTFDPSASFAQGTLVSFQVNMAAKDAAGNPKTTTSNFSFRVLRQAIAVLDSQAAIDGYWYSTPVVYPTSTALAAGDNTSNLYYQSFMSFDLSALPGVTVATEPQTTIVSATLEVTQTSTAGTPFSKLGNLLFEQIDYGPTLEVADAMVPALSTVSTSDAVSIVKSVIVTQAVRDDWASRVARSHRSQWRMRFTQNTNADSITDYIVFASGDNTTVASRPKLSVTYNYP